EAVTYARDPGANVNVADTALLIGEVQSNVFDWVELHTCAIGETIVAVACGTVQTLVFGLLEFTVANTYNTVDACPVIQAVRRTRGDAVVLTFIVRAIFSTIFLGVSERTDHTQRVVVLLVTVLQVETVGFVHHALHIALSVTTSYS